MRIGMIGLGKMGANMTERLLKGGHEVVAYDLSAAALEAASKKGAETATTLAELAGKLTPPRAAWVMVPAGAATDKTVEELAGLFDAGDVIVDGGNSNYKEWVHLVSSLEASGVGFVDAGTSGGVWGLTEGYCLMVGGTKEAVAVVEPALVTLAPEGGYAHVGPVGAGHFVKMVHNGIEYGIMAAYAEGLNILKHADAGKTKLATDAETTPLRQPELYRYDLCLPDIAEVWRRGSVIASWLLDLTATELLKEPSLTSYAGRVSDSGEGRWTIKAALDEAVPASVLSVALYERFSSRGNADFADRVLSAMRHEFGGHVEKAA